MINYNPKSWWGLIFKFHKSDTFRRLLPAMMTVALFTALVAYIDRDLLPNQLKGTGLVHSLLGFVISLLLVFRTNTAYERWWEGRRQWGALVNTSRNLALKLNAFLREDHRSRSIIAKHIGAYATVLNEHLRDIKPQQGRPMDGHGPNLIANSLFKEIDRLHRTGDLTGVHYLNLNSELTLLTDICGACERIKKTPIPYSYSLFIKKFIFVYIITMPFCFVHEFGYWTVLFSTFVFFVLASLELIAEEIENPFGDDANDLPTDELAKTIGGNVNEILLGKRAAVSSNVPKHAAPRARASVMPEH
ncbi:bestrophin family protein [Methylocaldum sp.]|uniref:bestrophin family protein n=1 Tax=Methylocaldum sp. TaxID=1969727 RepID=UPI002D642A39|nr:bestrophin family ion channel [Methylocaldum sp.]HYE36886.1 bestrophin family ion channel [Methylocaldum sp.]